MQKGFNILNLRSAMPLGLMAAGLITGFAVAVLPGRADQELSLIHISEPTRPY